MSKYINKIDKLCTFYEEYGASYMNAHEDFGDREPYLIFHENAASEEILRVYTHGKTDKQIFKEVNDFFKKSRKRWIFDGKIEELLQQYLDTDYNDLKEKRRMIKKIYELLKKSFEKKRKDENAE